jgi:hypothetical protein
MLCRTHGQMTDGIRMQDVVAEWQSKNAITSVVFDDSSTGDIAVGSTLALYGIN